MIAFFLLPITPVASATPTRSATRITKTAAGIIILTVPPDFFPFPGIIPLPTPVLCASILPVPALAKFVPSCSPSIKFPLFIPSISFPPVQRLTVKAPRNTALSNHINSCPPKPGHLRVQPEALTYSKKRLPIASSLLS